jgi:hypothetical protein
MEHHHLHYQNTSTSNWYTETKKGRINVILVPNLASRDVLNEKCINQPRNQCTMYHHGLGLQAFVVVNH